MKQIVGDQVERVVEKLLCDECPNPDYREEDCMDCQLFMNFRNMLLKGVEFDDE
jgi:hypothetical protein